MVEQSEFMPASPNHPSWRNEEDGLPREGSRDAEDGILILLVDDEPALLDLARIYLEQRGNFQLITARNAVDARRQLKQNRVDAIVAEAVLPGVDGIEFLKDLRGQGDRTPFVVFTGRGREEIAIEALNLGADYYLQKGGDLRAQFAELANFVRKAVEQSRVLAALKESERHYRDVVEDQTEFISRFLPDGTHVFVNEAYCRFFGKTREEILGKIFRPNIHPDDRQRLKRFFASLTQEHPVEFIEHRILMPDGSVRWLRWSDRAIFDEQGKVMEYQSVGRDVTDRRNAEEALRAQERMFAGIINHLPDPTFAIDSEGVVIAWNQAIEEMTGVPASEMLGKGDHEYAVPFYGERRPILIDLIFAPKKEIERYYEHVRRDGTTLVAETMLPHVRGVPRFLWGKATPLTNERGEIVGAVESIRDLTEKKRLELAIQESERKYRKFVDEARMAIVVAQYGKIQFMNPYGLENFGVSAEEVQGMPIGALIHPEDRAKVLDTYRRRMAGEAVPTIYPFRVINRAGETRMVEINVIRTTWEGRPATLNLLHDITERVQAETALREREALYRSLAETAPAMIYRIDLDGNVQYVNSVAAAQFGQAPDAIAGKHLRDLFPPALAEQHLAAIRQVVKTEKTLHQEIQEIFPTGSAWVDVRLTPVRDADGRVNGVLGISFNINQRKWMEEQLRGSERFLSSIFQSIQDGINVLDPEMRILRVNHAMEEWYPDQLPLVGKRCYEAYRGRDTPCEVCPTKRTLATGAPAHEVVPLTGAGRGRVGWLDLLSFPLFDEGTGELKGVIEYMRDITEQKMMEEIEKKAFEQIEKNINQLSILNDHLRNPLAVIVGLADLEGGPTPEKILRQAKEIDRIITELDMGWLESEKIREFMRKHYGVVAGESEERG